MRYPLADLPQTERMRLLYVTLAFMSVTSAALVGRTVGDALFLSHFHIDNLSYMYVGTALVVCSVSFVYGLFVKTVAITRLIGFSGIIFIAMLLGLRIALDHPWPGFRIGAYFMGDLVVNVPIMLFWSFAALLFDPRDAKRFFGLIGAGGTFACICTGAIVKPFTSMWGTSNLLLLVAAYLLVFILAVWRVTKIPKGTAQPSASQPPSQNSATKYYAQLVRTPQVRNLVLLVLSATFALTLVDYQFKAGARMNHSPDQLAGFFGDFYSVSSIVALFIQLFLVHRILQKGSVLLGLCLLPAGLLIGTTATVFTQQFGWIVATKFTVQIMLFTIDLAALQMLYLGIPIQSRSQARAFVDGIAKPLAIAGTGIILIAASRYVELHLLALGGILGSIAWLWLSRVNYKSYVAALIESLGSRRFDFSQETSGLNDKTLENRIRQSLREAPDEELIYLVGMVADLDEVDWTPEFRELINRDLPDIKIESLNYLSHHGDETDLNMVLSLINHDNAQVRAAAIIAVAKLGGQEIIPKIEPKLQDPNPRVRSAAIASLIDSGDLDYLLEAGIVLKRMLQSSDSAERLATAKAIESISSAALVKPIIGLLQDDDPQIRIAALETCQSHLDPRLIPVVITLLADPNTASKTTATLPLFGKPTLEHLIPYLELRDREGAFEGAHHVPEIMAAIGDPSVMPVLSAAAQTNDLPLRQRILKSYCQLAQTAPVLKPYLTSLYALAQQELDAATLRSSQLQAFANQSGSDFLISALEEAKTSHLRNAFRLLDTCHPDIDLMQILDSLLRTSSTDHANALEVLENVLPKHIRPQVISLFESTAHPSASPVPTSDLLNLLSPEESRWIITGSLMFCTENQSLISPQNLSPLLDHKDPVIRETTLYALNKIGSEQALQDHISRLKQDPDLSVRNLARSLTS